MDPDLQAFRHLAGGAGGHIDLGLAALTRMTQVVPIPVYALGGVDSPQRVRDCLDEGATGVAVMGAVMRAEDPARFVKELMTV